jgi:hypothetical protein
MKVQFVYPLPSAFTISGAFKNLPGAPDQASYIVTNAVASSALGRNLSACPAAGPCNATVSAMIVPYINYQGDASGVLFDTRLNELDLRLTRAFKIQKGRLTGIVDLYNVGNARPAQQILSTYTPGGGGTWERPATILGGRLLKVGAQISF